MILSTHSSVTRLPKAKACVMYEDIWCIFPTMKTYVIIPDIPLNASQSD
jgi:hypothetical protein